MNAIKKLGSLILVLAISLPCFAKKKVELIGRWDLKTKSITFQLPVQTWVQDNNKDLLLEFTADSPNPSTNSISEFSEQSKGTTCA